MNRCLFYFSGKENLYALLLVFSFESRIKFKIRSGWPGIQTFVAVFPELYVFNMF